MPKVNALQSIKITERLLDLLKHNNKTVYELQTQLQAELGPIGTSAPSIRRLVTSLVNEGVIKHVSKDPGHGGTYRYGLIDGAIVAPTILNTRSGQLVKITDLAVTGGINPRLVEAVNYTRLGAAELILCTIENDTKQAAQVRVKMLETLDLLENVVTMLKSLTTHNGIWVNPLTTQTVNLVTAGKLKDSFVQHVTETFDPDYFETVQGVITEFVMTIEGLGNSND